MTNKELKNLKVTDFIVHKKHGICRITLGMDNFLGKELHLRPTTYKGALMIANECKVPQWNGFILQKPISKVNVEDIRLATKEEIESQRKCVLESIFDLQAIFLFCQSHKVEILFQDDLQHHCFIDYKENDLPYAIELTAIEAMIKGIINYEIEQNKL